jgi:hypothetical protein
MLATCSARLSSPLSWTQYFARSKEVPHYAIFCSFHPHFHWSPKWTSVVLPQGHYGFILVISWYLDSLVIAVVPATVCFKRLLHSTILCDPNKIPGFQTVRNLRITVCYKYEIYGYGLMLRMSCTWSSHRNRSPTSSSWSWALFEKPPIVQLLNNFPAFYGTRRFITVFTRALHWSLSSARSIQSIALRTEKFDKPAQWTPCIIRRGPTLYSLYTEGVVKWPMKIKQWVQKKGGGGNRAIFRPPWELQCAIGSYWAHHYVIIRKL